MADEDPNARGVLARMVVGTYKARRKVWVTANNKAEGSAPLSLLKLAEEIARELEKRPRKKSYKSEGWNFSE